MIAFMRAYMTNCTFRAWFHSREPDNLKPLDCPGLLVAFSELKSTASPLPVQDSCLDSLVAHALEKLASPRAKIDLPPLPKDTAEAAGTVAPSCGDWLIDTFCSLAHMLLTLTACRDAVETNHRDVLSAVQLVLAKFFNLSGQDNKSNELTQVSRG